MGGDTVHQFNTFIAVIQNVYPETANPPDPVKISHRPASPERTIAHAGASGTVLAVDLAGLVAQARRADGMIEFVPQVGDFVSVDEPVLRLYSGAAAIDQLHRLLRRVGLRQLRDEEICDAAGELRLVFRTPNWEDFVHLACTEIRHCGAGSVQIMRRMRSMLENLIQTLPQHRHDELRRQLALLDRTIEQSYTFPEDQALARIPDPQGLGGTLGLQTVSGIGPDQDG